MIRINSANFSPELANQTKTDLDNNMLGNFVVPNDQCVAISHKI